MEKTLQLFIDAKTKKWNEYCLPRHSALECRTNGQSHGALSNDHKLQV
jgi:hypothetical protein